MPKAPERYKRYKLQLYGLLKLSVPSIGPSFIHGPFEALRDDLNNLAVWSDCILRLIIH